MFSPVHRSSRTILGSVFVALALALSLVAPVLGTGSTTPTYKATLAPTTAAAGTGNTATFTIKQLVNDDYFHSKEFGSARITAPTGWTITGASSTRGTATFTSSSVTVDKVDLDNLGQTADITIQSTIPCGAAASGTWIVVGHSTYTYDSPYAKVLKQDPSSVLTATVTACSLAFVTGRQPASAATGAVVTSAPADPSGPTVQVQLRDGNGAPAAQAGLNVSVSIKPGTGTAGAGIAGVTNDATDANGRADFAPTISLAGHDYKLVAAAGAGIDPGTSAVFDISDVAKVCSGACSGTAASGNTTATISATSNGGVLSMSVGLDDIDCNNAVNHFYVATSETVTWDITPAAGRTAITIKLDAASVTKSFLKYEVCFSSPASTFVNKYGATIAAGDAGILPWCLNCNKPSGGPCVVAKWFDLHGNVYVKFSVPAGDPRGKS